MKEKTKKNWHSPVITRVKLSPEQAVLSCCDKDSGGAGGARNWSDGSVCQTFGDGHGVNCGGAGTGAGSMQS